MVPDLDIIARFFEHFLYSTIDMLFYSLFMRSMSYIQTLGQEFLAKSSLNAYKYTQNPTI